MTISIHGHWPRIAISLMFLFIAHRGAAQSLEGVVTQDEHGHKHGLSQAHVYWLGTREGAITDEHGHFTIDRATGTTLLVISHVAFENDTVDTRGVTSVAVHLTTPRSADAVEVSAEAPDTYIANIPQRTEVITARELEKAACCDLAGCFGTTTSVQPEATDVVTDTRQLTMLGLDGVYTQILIDNVPLPGDRLSRQFGVQTLPGPWIDRIAVSKGATAVGQGAGSVSGLVNVLLLEGGEEQRLFFNAFGMSMGEQQYNAYASGASGKWSSILALHGVRHGRRVDRNGDGFMDAPLVDRFSALSKWTWQDEEVISRSGVRVAWEDRLGGQMDYRPDEHRGGTQYFGQRIENLRTDVYNKTDIRVGESGVIRTHALVSAHDLRGVFGTGFYDVRQYAAYGDVWYTNEVSETQEFTAGVSMAWSRLEDELDWGRNPHSKTFVDPGDMVEAVPGMFVESTSKFFDNAVSLLTGVRVDHYNEHGAVMTPRVFLRVSVDEETTLRASVGSAFRTVAVLAENSAYLSSWRDLRIEGDVKPERAVNLGVNLVRNYDLDIFHGTLTAEVYHTEFRDQFVVDLDRSASTILFHNLGEDSRWNHFMLEGTAVIPAVLSFRLGYILTDAKETHGGRETTPPFLSKHRALGVVTFDTFDDNVNFTFSAEWRDAQRLPAMFSAPTEHRLPANSPAYTILNAHVNVRLGRVDVYSGIENLLDFRQSNPILNATQPFQPWFDPSLAWGPAKGREVYAGLRLRVGEF